MNYSRMGYFVGVLAAAFVSVPVLTAGSVSINVSNTGPVMVPVNIIGASDVYAFQFDLSFDASILTLLSISEGSFLPSAGSTIFVPGVIDNIAGTASGTADTLVGPIRGVSGSGELADFTFEAIRTGTATLAVSDVILLDSFLRPTAGTVTLNAFPAPEPSGLPWVGGLVLTGMLWRKGRSGTI